MQTAQAEFSKVMGGEIVLTELDLHWSDQRGKSVVVCGLYDKT